MKQQNLFGRNVAWRQPSPQRGCAAAGAGCPAPCDGVADGIAKRVRRVSLYI